MECQLEALEGAMSKGEEIDLDQYGRAVGQLRRVLESLGVERRSKDVTLDLKSYIAANASAEAA